MEATDWTIHEKPYDLSKRLFLFACLIVRVVRFLHTRGPIAVALSYQLLKSGTSAGANYEEGAFSFSSTTANGYSSSLGAPEGRYIAPANTADCLQIKTGDCAPRTLLIRAPFFTRFDVGVTKKFPIKGTTHFEVRFDVLNLFDNINFDPVANPGSGSTILRTTTAYRDPSNTYDPGGRLGQLMFRINW